MHSGVSYRSRIHVLGRVMACLRLAEAENLILKTLRVLVSGRRSHQRSKADTRRGPRLLRIVSSRRRRQVGFTALPHIVRMLVLRPAILSAGRLNTVLAIINVAVGKLPWRGSGDVLPIPRISVRGRGTRAVLNKLPGLIALNLSCSAELLHQRLLFIRPNITGRLRSRAG